MGWDPFHIEQRHRETRDAIAAGKPGYAQSDVAGTIVSLHFDGGEVELHHIGLDGKHAHEIMDEIVADVANDDGVASPRAFRKSFVQHMIDDRRAYPKGTWKKKHAEADRIESLLEKRPELFV